jgi:hypothetical protein
MVHLDNLGRAVAVRGIARLLACIVDLIQWPAMVVTVIAAWYVASAKKGRRGIGFWLYLVSNGLWIAWGVYAHAYALIVLQVCLAFMNVRGLGKNAPSTSTEC